MMITQIRNCLFYLKARGNQTTEYNNEHTKQVANALLPRTKWQRIYLNKNKDLVQGSSFNKNQMTI